MEQKMNSRQGAKAQSKHGSGFLAPWRLCVRLLPATIVIVFCGNAFGQLPGTDKPAAAPAAEPAATPDANAGAPSATDELSVEQARLADRYKRLEEVVGRLAEL